MNKPLNECVFATNLPNGVIMFGPMSEEKKSNIQIYFTYKEALEAEMRILCAPEKCEKWETFAKTELFD